MQDTNENYIQLEKVSKIYGTKEVKIIAVDEISFNISKGEFAVIVGPRCRQDNRSEYSRRNGYCHQWQGLGRWEKHCQV